MAEQSVSELLNHLGLTIRPYLHLGLLLTVIFFDHVYLVLE